MISILSLGSIPCAPVPQASALTAPQASNDVRANLDEYFRRLEAIGFSGSVLVAQGDQTILRGGYGLADRTLGIAVTPQTAFSVGSITKQFTSTAIMLLQQRGKLSLADTLAAHLDFLPADKRDITIHQVLTHTSGLADDYWDQYPELSREEYYRRAATNSPLVNPPGEGYLYSNFGYDLLGRIIEAVSGVSYEEFVVEKMFRPSGMMHTGFRLPDWADGQVTMYQDRATRVWTRVGLQIADPLARAPCFNPLGSGGLLSTVDDMQRWHEVLMGDELLTEESKDQLFMPVLSNYACGWRITRMPGIVVMHHGGYDATLGVAAGYYRIPAQNMVFVLLANTTMNRQFDADNVVMQIFGAMQGRPILSIPRGIDLAADELMQWVGTYELHDGATFDIRRVGPRLVGSTEQALVAHTLTFPDAFTSKSRPLPPDVADVIEGISRDNFEPLRAALWERSSYERARDHWREFFHERREVWGAYRSATLGYEVESSFEGAPEQRIYVALHFERGVSMIRVLRNPAGRLYIDQGGIDEYVELYLLPQSANEFQGWFFKLQTGPRLKFFADRVEIHGEMGHVTARKLSPDQ